MALISAGLPPPNPIYSKTLTLTANGNSGLIPAAHIGTLFMSAVATAVAGTTPSAVISLDQIDAAGNVVPGVASLAAITAVGSVFTSIGPGLVVPQLLTNSVQLRWVVTGTAGPSITVALSLIGR